MKKVIALICCLALLCCCFTACGKAEGQTQDETAQTTAAANEDGQTAAAEDRWTNSPMSGAKGKKVAWIFWNLGFDYARQVCYGLIQACEDYGIEPVIMTGYTNVQEQLTLVENAIEQGVDAIVCNPVDPYGFEATMQVCEEKGIPLISQLEIESDVCQVTSVIQTDNFQMGADVAQLVADDLGGKGNVVILRGIAGNVNFGMKCDGIYSVLDQYPGIEVVADMSHEDSQQGASVTMSDLCQSFGKDIDAVICMNEFYTLGSIVSLEEYGYVLGEDVKLYSCNYSTELDDYIQSGQCRCGIYSWGTLFGYWSVELCARALSGMPVPQFINCPTDFVTSENLEKYHDISTAAYEFDFNAYQMKH